MADGSAPADDARVPPSCMDAEAAVLSALFLDPGATVELEPEHFYSDANRWIYRAVRAVGADIVLVAHWLKQQGALGRVGGQVYLAQIVDATPAVARVADHAALVRECWRRRVLIAAFQRCEAELYAGTLSPQDAWSRMKEVCSG